MSDEVLALLLNEDARLTAELEAHPAYQKREAIRRVIKLYAPDYGQAGSAALRAGTARLRAGADRLKAALSSDGRSGTSASSIRAAAAEYLRMKGARAQTPEIVDALEAEGIQVQSPNKVATTSSYLSSSDLFDNVRGQGYGLREWSRQPELAARTGNGDSAEAPEPDWDAERETADPAKEPAVQ